MYSWCMWIWRSVWYVDMEVSVVCDCGCEGLLYIYCVLLFFSNNNLFTVNLNQIIVNMALLYIKINTNDPF